MNNLSQVPEAKKHLSWVVALTALLASGCTATVNRQQPVGSMFPQVSGTALDDKNWSIPTDLKGSNALLLIGFKQDAQFDIDRWLIGIDQKKYKINVFEMPVISGWIPRMISGKIDSGMRSGIPNELWKIVVTVYKDADKVIDFLGNADPLNARVVVLDTEGKVAWFHDRGFSVAVLNQLAEFFPQSNNQENCK